jgi:hypothetical protein
LRRARPRRRRRGFFAGGIIFFPSSLHRFFAAAEVPGVGKRRPCLWLRTRGPREKLQSFSLFTPNFRSAEKGAGAVGHCAAIASVQWPDPSSSPAVFTLDCTFPDGILGRVMMNSWSVLHESLPRAAGTGSRPPPQPGRGPSGIPERFPPAGQAGHCGSQRAV